MSPEHWRTGLEFSAVGKKGAVTSGIPRAWEKSGISRRNLGLRTPYIRHPSPFKPHSYRGRARYQEKLPNLRNDDDDDEDDDDPLSVPNIYGSRKGWFHGQVGMIVGLPRVMCKVPTLANALAGVCIYRLRRSL
jgi:hypothetical protein